MTDHPPRIIFAGTPDFAATHLSALLAAGYPICAVYTQPDRPAGRGKKLAASPVKQLALTHGIPVYQPVTLNTPEEQATLAALQADVIIVVAYGLLLPPAVLAIPARGCINVHASLLPRWRGAAPIQRAIEAGDAETGVCLMQMEAGLDTGPVLVARRQPISRHDTGQTLHDALAALGAATLVTALPDILSGALPANPQTEAGVTYARKLSKAEAKLDFCRPAHQVCQCIRAFNPFPVSWCLLPSGDSVRVWAASVLEGHATTASPGTVTAISPEGIRVACGHDELLLTELQLPNRNRLPVRDILNGHVLPLQIGDTLT